MRAQWQFEYSGMELLKAAMLKATHHRAREKWWGQEGEKADADLRAHGVEIRDQPVTGGIRPQAMFDPARAARWEECRSKVDSHKKRAEEYELFARAFERNQEAGFKLDCGDMEFFGL